MELEKKHHITNLYYDIYIDLFSFFTPKDIANLNCTCKYFKKLLESGKFWKTYITRLGPKAYIKCANISVDSIKFFQFFKFATKMFYDNTNNDSTKTLQTLIPLEASSVDYDQSIEKVLIDNKRTFWSSLGSGSEDSVEHLLFLYPKGFVIPLLLELTFFKAIYFAQGYAEFPCKQLQMEFSFDGLNWEYGSEKIDVHGKHQVKINMSGKVGLARYIRVNLFGKTAQQYSDNLYYVAVENVKFYGYKVDMYDKDNKIINDLLIDSYASWALNKEDLIKIEADRPKDIVRYYKSQLFFSDIYAKFLTSIMDKDNEKAWECLETNKFLLTMEKVFVDIFKIDKEFGIYYLTKVIRGKRRNILTYNESLLLLLLFLNLNNDQTDFPDIVQLINDKYQVLELIKIKYIQLSTKMFQTLIEVLNIGQQSAIDFLEKNYCNSNYFEIINFYRYFRKSDRFPCKQYQFYPSELSKDFRINIKAF